MSEAAALSHLWRAMAPRAVIAPPTPPSVGEIAAAADAAGEARGRAAERAALEPLRTTLAAAEGAWRAAMTIDTETLQPLYADLVTRLAQAVVDGELRASPAAIERLVAAALAAVEVDGDATLYLCEADAAHYREANAVVDATLSPGEIRLETPRHVVAASLSARLAEIVAGTA